MHSRFSSISALLVVCVFAGISATSCPAQPLNQLTYGVSGANFANAVTTDAKGNIYIVGTTNSNDLPLLDASQSSNAGTELMFSRDAGVTWKPLGNLPNAYASSPFSRDLPVAIDPTNPAVFYVGFNGTMFKSTDSGRHFSSGATLPSATRSISIAIDPAHPANVYAGTDVGVFKSTDGGATWSNASSGLLILSPPHFVNQLVFDPHHPAFLWAVVAGVGFLSTDGANSWSQLSLPGPAAGNASILTFAFDAATPGIVYTFGINNGSSYLLKTTDAGQTWTQLNIPFFSGVLVPDPVRAGYLYALSSTGPQSAVFYRSANGGSAWQSFPFPSPFASSVAIDPANPNIVIAGSYRSTDNGQTWSPTAVSRDIQMAFARTGSGVVFATGPITTDIFIAKFQPDGKTLEFATYYGGMGNETASGIQVDKLGNIWVAGSTTSFDLPVSAHAFQKQLKGVTNAFVAEFSPQGRLHAATYVGGSGADTVSAMRLNSAGEPWIYGQTNSLDFPIFKGGPSPFQPGATYSFLAKLIPSTSGLLYSASVDGADIPIGMAIDPEDNILLTGTTFSSNFPLTPNVVHGQSAPSTNYRDAFLIKLDGSGNTIFSTYLGGSTAAVTQFGNELENQGVAVTSDNTGIYLTGNTSATDFPTTPGAYQAQLKAGCLYPSFAVDTGFIGTILEYSVDDVFLVKLSPDGKTLLYSTLVGGSCFDRATDIAVAPSGAVFLTGETNSTDFPVVYPFENAPAPETYMSFVSMISPNGNTIPYSTYLLAGFAPTLALNRDGSLEIAGSVGYGAQSITFSGFPNGPIVPITNAYLASLNLSGAPPKMDLTAVLNAFSLLPGPVAPGEIVQLNLPDFEPAQHLNLGLKPASPLGTSLSGVRVLIANEPALVMTVSGGKVVAIVPDDLAAGPNATVQVNYKGTLSNTLAVSTAPTALGLLSANGSGTGPANARNSDGTSNSAKNPAKRGSRVTVYFTGAGVPPTTISTGFGSASIAPLHGFVPGIFAAYFDVPSDPDISSPFPVSLQAAGSSPAIAGSTSQSLLVYIE